MWHTDQPSIQGAWTPFTGKNPALNLVNLPQNELFETLNKEQTATEKLLEIYQAKQIEKEAKNNDKQS